MVYHVAFVFVYLEKLQCLFPAREQSELLAIYHLNNGEIDATVDDILEQQGRVLTSWNINGRCSL